MDKQVDTNKENLDFMQVLSLNKKLNIFIEFLRINLRIEQKHTIILVENLQKNLFLNHALEIDILNTLERAFNKLPKEQSEILANFLDLKSVIHFNKLL